MKRVSPVRKCVVLLLSLSLLFAMASMKSVSKQGKIALTRPASRREGHWLHLPYVAKNWLPAETPASTVTPTPTPTTTPTPTATATTTPTAPSLLPGDILTRDDDLISFMEAHDAIYVGDGQIIDALPDGGVQYRSLEGFIADADDYVIAQRLAAWSEEVTQGALDYAVGHIGTPYDYAYFGGKDTEDSMYCSELVWRAYLSQGIDLDSNGGPWVWPGEIVRSPLLVEIDIDLGPAATSTSSVAWAANGGSHVSVARHQR
jgi:cell wall-associated NlpC family hydrolase